LLTIWFDPGMTWGGEPAGKRGRKPDGSDGAIQTCLAMKAEGRPEIRPVDGLPP
jgi:hypothetical protein